MKLRFISLFCIFLTVLTLFCAVLPALAVADTANYTKTHAEKGLLSQADYAKNAGSSQYDWEAFSATISGDNGKEYLYSLISKLPPSDCNNVTDLHRSAVLIYAMGGNPRAVCGRDIVAESVFYRKNLGAQGANGYIWALIVLDAYGTQVPDDAINTRESIINSLLELQNANGGFGISNGKSDIDVTAMAVTAIAKYGETEKVNNAIFSALEWISSQQLPDGDFTSWGVANAESTAQVIIALRSAGIDIFSDQRFIKNGNTVYDGLIKYYKIDGFVHTTQDNTPTPFANGQGFCALAAVEKNGSIFDFNYLSLATIDEAITDTVEKTATAGSNIKQILLIAVSAVGAITASAVFIKRKKLSDLIVILVVFGIIIALISVLKIQTPQEYYEENLESVTPNSQTVTLCIRCDEVIDSNKFDKALIENGYIPQNGIILPCTEYVLREGDSVFDILQRAVKHNKIQFEFSGGAHSAYIEGISHLYEFDCGNGSGWTYAVNGKTPNYGISKYKPKDNDKIELIYVLSYN